MQTLTELALEMITWERVTLSGGAHRIQSIAAVQGDSVAIATFSDCSYSDLFIDDLTSVKAAMGICGGVWCGMMSGDDPIVVVLALRME